MADHRAVALGDEREDEGAALAEQVHDVGLGVAAEGFEVHAADRRSLAGLLLVDL